MERHSASARRARNTWLVGEHRSNGERKYYLSNLPADTPIKDLAGAIKARWVCEQPPPPIQLRAGDVVLQRRRRDLTPITGKAFFNDPKLRLVGEPTPSARGDDLKAAHCPKTVLIPVHKDNATDSRQPIKAAALGCLRSGSLAVSR
jgi:hypothetical protein